MHLIFNKRIDLMIVRLLFSYKTKNISICLQRIDNIETIFTFFQKSVEKDIQNVDWNVFKNDHIIFLDKLTIFNKVHQNTINLLNKQTSDFYWYQNFFYKIQHIFILFSIDSLCELQNVQTFFYLLIVF